MSARRVAPAMTVALCVAMAVLVSVLAHRTNSDVRVGDARRDALLAAPRIAREVLSYDYRTIDRDIARARADSTGEFAAQYADRATELENVAVADHAIVQAQPHAPGIVSADANSVVILLFIDQVSVRQLPGETTPATHVAQSRVEMTLTHDGGRWRLATLSTV